MLLCSRGHTLEIIIVTLPSSIRFVTFWSSGAFWVAFQSEGFITPLFLVPVLRAPPLHMFLLNKALMYSICPLLLKNWQYPLSMCMKRITHISTLICPSTKVRLCLFFSARTITNVLTSANRCRQVGGWRWYHVTYPPRLTDAAVSLHADPVGNILVDWTHYEIERVISSLNPTHIFRWSAPHQKLGVGLSPAYWTL